MSDDKATTSSEGAFAGLMNSRLPTRSVEAAYERALGSLAISFSLLHFLLERYLWELCGVEAGVGKLLTKDLPTKHLVEKLRSLLKKTIPKERDRKTILAILAEVDKAAQYRNDLLHALWLIDDDKPVLCYRRRSSLPDAVAPSVDEIKEFNASLSNLTAKFIIFKKENPHMRPLGLALSSLKPEK